MPYGSYNLMNISSTKKERALRHALLYSPIDYSSTADSSVISIISGVFFTTSILR